MVCGRFAEFVLVKLSGDHLKHIAEQTQVMCCSVSPTTLSKIVLTVVLGEQTAPVLSTFNINR